MSTAGPCYHGEARRKRVEVSGQNLRSLPPPPRGARTRSPRGGDPTNNQPSRPPHQSDRPHRHRPGRRIPLLQPCAMEELTVTQRMLCRKSIISTEHELLTAADGD